jgi:Z1 domain
MTASISILSKIKPPLRWEPVPREFTQEFLESKGKGANGPTYMELTSGDDSVLHEAQRILGRCLPPTEPQGRETGLVVGYVQSGKTMSFETVISLARDNGYGMVIVFAGTKKNLREQSEERLKKDLGIDEGENWYHYSNPARGVASQIKDKIDAWRKKPAKKLPILITVLKQVDHLENLATVLKVLPLVGVPVLIIDDESDQASLNTNAARIRAARVLANARSTTYDRICAVRDIVPHHSYLQYTATPQANLLLAQTDLLNPSFAELVTPGNTYTGGKAFFKENPGLVIDIPAIQVPGPSNLVSGPPKTLTSALRYFLLVCAQHAITRVRGKDRNRSMMVHPAMQTSSHKRYKTWVDNARTTLTTFVESKYQKAPSEVEERFLVEYKSLKSTFPELKPLAELIESMVNDVFGELNCVEVNGTPDAEKKINWKQPPYWILVGGAKLDRGYTVEGLAITYMPRPLGNNPAADTLQQRARFFGYKKTYLGLCRVFVQRDVRDAFSHYVDHEEFVRSALVSKRGESLRDWRRDFILDALLRPTRPNVIGLSTRRIAVDGWIKPDVLHRDAEAVEMNRKLLTSVVDKWTQNYGPSINAANFPQFKSSKGESPNFIIEAVPLRAVLEDFLLNLQVRDPSDAEEHTAILIGMAELLRGNETLKTDVYLMNNLVPGYRKRDAGRGFPAGHANAPINQYFSQTAGTLNDPSFCSSERISLQLRRFDLGTKQRDRNSTDIFNVTWFALNVPGFLRKNLLIEDRS